ncbi:unnamed protein product [Moneuplotes crassus]|uniref:Uncharacterized protein n=1 Tax=Euplotes crassus TaxID=5936 RepID=A0AAD1UJ54_EUPCR|nr:unnamed protein product [Moneuplotes crassus]
MENSDILVAGGDYEKCCLKRLIVTIKRVFRYSYLLFYGFLCLEMCPSYIRLLETLKYCHKQSFCIDLEMKRH